jgi:hypothetical protein
VDESPSNPPPVDSWEEEADKETEEGKRPLALTIKSGQCFDFLLVTVLLFYSINNSLFRHES